MAPEGDERVGDVLIYYATSDTCCHVATTTVDNLLDYVMNTPEDAERTYASVQQQIGII